MSEHKPRLRVLVAIVIYKCCTIGLLTCGSIGLFLTSKKYAALFAFAEDLDDDWSRSGIRNRLGY